jgi:uncharacterized integral membrane protein
MEREGMKVKIVLVLVLVVLLGALFVQNTQIVTYRVYFWTISMSQMILVPIVAAVGFLIGYVLGTLRRKKTT